MIIETLIKLFEISIVASNVLGFSNNSKIVLEDFSVSLFNSSTSLGVKEKNATSDPEISAELISKINNNTADIIIGAKLAEVEMFSNKVE